MKNLLICSILVAAITADCVPAAPPPPLEVVPSVDLTRYAGTWYEIARLPNWFQKKCASDVVATYTLLDDGTIKVVNRCRDANGETDEAEGKAKVAVKDGSNAKLKVRFAPRLLSVFPFVWGDYWIINLAPDYSYAAVGDPGRKYFWILSRTPSMDDSTFRTIVDQTTMQGYNLSGLIRTKHNPD